MTPTAGTILFFLACLCVVPPTSARAQSVDDPVSSARIRLGPFGVTPSIGLTNLGIDSNVFSQVEDPKSDFTFTLAPQARAWFRAGRSRTAALARADLVYFRRYASERSLDGEVNGRFEVPGNRLTPWVSGGILGGRQRVGYEIDLRSRRIVKDLVIGVDTRIGAKTRIGLSAGRTAYSHDADAFFLGSGLQQRLNRRSDVVGVAYKQALTVLTTVLVQAETVRDRFEFASSQNADSVRILAGLDLADQALIAGRVRIGYRRLTTRAGTLPGYSGPVASILVGVALRGRTKVEVSADRDVIYSFEFDYPHYILSGGTVTITPRLTNGWDVQGRIGGQRLAYASAATAALSDRIDRYTLFGAGVGYYLGPTVRIGLNFDRQQRRSPVERRAYDGYRIGTSVTYGR